MPLCSYRIPPSRRQAGEFAGPGAMIAALHTRWMSRPHRASQAGCWAARFILLTLSPVVPQLSGTGSNNQICRQGIGGILFLNIIETYICIEYVNKFSSHIPQDQKYVEQNLKTLPHYSLYSFLLSHSPTPYFFIKLLLLSVCCASSQTLTNTMYGYGYTGNIYFTYKW